MHDDTSQQSSADAGSGADEMLTMLLALQSLRPRYRRCHLSDGVLPCVRLWNVTANGNWSRLFAPLSNRGKHDLMLVL